MDFFERWFGIYPDGGSGLLEVLYLFAAINAIAFGAWYRAHGRRRPTEEGTAGRTLAR